MCRNPVTHGSGSSGLFDVWDGYKSEVVGSWVWRTTNHVAWTSFISVLCPRCGWFPEAYVKPLEDAREMEEPAIR